MGRGAGRTGRTAVGEVAAAVAAVVRAGANAEGEAGAVAEARVRAAGAKVEVTVVAAASTVASMVAATVASMVAATVAAMVVATVAAMVPAAMVLVAAMVVGRAGQGKVTAKAGLEGKAKGWRAAGCLMPAGLLVVAVMAAAGPHLDSEFLKDGLVPLEDQAVMG